MKDQISYWRFSNQVKILNKAKFICEKNNVSVKSIPPKLLCPYLENASLEDDDELQDKWAILLVNMVDSEQNIQSHVFPYILSQLSKDEFNILDHVLSAKKQRILSLENELSIFLETRSDVEAKLKGKVDSIDNEIEKLRAAKGHSYSGEAIKLLDDKRKLQREISSLKYKDWMLKREIADPQVIPENDVKEFELANIIRLGLAKVIYEASAGTHSIDIPRSDEDMYTSVDLDIEVETETSTILTELGEMFVEACQEKHA